MMLNRVSVCVLIACTLLFSAAQARGTDYSWFDATAGTWGVPGHWTPPIGPPGSGDLARHNDPAVDSFIIVQKDQVCRDFQGDGSEPGVRYLMIESGATLTAESSITGSNGLFPIRSKDGSSTGSRTKLSVGTLTSGGASNLLFERSDPSQDAGDFVSITVKGDLSNSTIDFPGSANSVSAYGNAVDTDVNLPGVGNVVGVTGNVTKSTGSPSWTIGNAGSLSVGGDIGSGINGGVDVTSLSFRATSLSFRATSFPFRATSLSFRATSLSFRAPARNLAGGAFQLDSSLALGMTMGASQ